MVSNRDTVTFTVFSLIFRVCINMIHALENVLVVFIDRKDTDLDSELTFQQRCCKKKDLINIIYGKLKY